MKTQKKYDTFIPLKERQIVSEKGDCTVVDKDGVVRDDVVGLVLPPKHYDGRVFCKMYKEGIQGMLKLSSPAMKVLLYILFTMWYSDSVEFNLKKCKDFTGYKNNSYIYKAIAELRRYDIIRRINPMRYQVNPNCFFKGNRMRLINKNK